MYVFHNTILASYPEVLGNKVKKIDGFLNIYLSGRQAVCALFWIWFLSNVKYFSECNISCQSRHDFVKVLWMIFSYKDFPVNDNREGMQVDVLEHRNDVMKYQFILISQKANSDFWGQEAMKVCSWLWKFSSSDTGKNRRFTFLCPVKN